MIVSDYILAIIGIVACCVWIIFSTSLLLDVAMTPNPGKRAAVASRNRCLSLVAATMALVWFAGVLWFGQWGWLI